MCMCKEVVLGDCETSDMGRHEYGHLARGEYCPITCDLSDAFGLQVNASI